MNDGPGRFVAAPGAWLTPGWHCHVVCVADFDGNGTADLVIGSEILLQVDGMFVAAGQLPDFLPEGLALRVPLACAPYTSPASIIA